MQEWVSSCAKEAPECAARTAAPESLITSLLWKQLVQNAPMCYYELQLVVQEPESADLWVLSQDEVTTWCLLIYGARWHKPLLRCWKKWKFCLQKKIPSLLVHF